MLFEHDRQHRSAHHRRLHALFELAITVSNFMAAFLFVIGSVMFLFEAWITTGTWLFILGSMLFMVSPALNVIREIKLAALGDYADLARKFEDTL